MTIEIGNINEKNSKNYMKKNKGQAVLVLILIMTVILAIGLSIVQKSLTDVSTANKVEQSARAFSAAEAGIEQLLKGDSTDINFSENKSSATLIDSGVIPTVPTPGFRQQPLEYPPLAVADVAHVWLADYNSTTNPPEAFYKGTTLDVYWGNSITERAALELTLVYFDGTQYKSRKWFLDHNFVRTPPNNFTTVSCTGYMLGTTPYQCKYTLGVSPDPPLPSAPSKLMLFRVRLLYNTKSSQPFAVQAVSNCGKDCSIPPQARELISTGVSGDTQRRVKLFQKLRGVPAYFDYAIISAGDIRK